MSSSLSASHQSHMNIVDSRKHAVKLMMRDKGMTFIVVSAKTPKCRVIDAIKRGVYDGWYYCVNYTDKVIHINYRENALDINSINPEFVGVYYPVFTKIPVHKIGS